LAIKAIEFGEERKLRNLLRRSTSFNVIDAGINQKPVCDFLSVINKSNLPNRGASPFRTSYPNPNYNLTLTLIQR